MSDYIFSSVRQPAGRLLQCIARIRSDAEQNGMEFHGEWGSLAVGYGKYAGFLPHETEKYVLVVVGAPVLYFRDNDFLSAPDSNEATRAIFERWQIKKCMRWDEDLSGPFTVLLIEKETHVIRVVTDLMAFIPVFFCRKRESFHIGTHVDAVARACGEGGRFDRVSLLDFVVNSVVTYPYTAYQNLRQLPPSAISVFEHQRPKAFFESYWVPREVSEFHGVGEAAEALRKGVAGYVERVTRRMRRVAHFISGGEDSRVIAGMLPNHLERDSFIFLDKMNTEGRIASKVAKAYGASFTVGYRSKTHYLEILTEASRLVGSGCQYVHAHSLGFDRKLGLHRYGAVFGGFGSDTLLKGYCVRKPKRLRRLPFIPHVRNRGYIPHGVQTEPWVDLFECYDEVRTRQARRFEEIQQVRPLSAAEWYHCYPYSMTKGIPNFYTTRRLFRSYEPFLCKESVKISAGTPISWKTNRRIFHRAMRPYLKPTRWILHGSGYLPYFGFWANMPFHFVVWTCMQLARRIGLVGRNQGPWCDYRELCNTAEWGGIVRGVERSVPWTNFLKAHANAGELLKATSSMPVLNRLNLLQTCYMVDSKARQEGDVMALTPPIGP